VEVLSATISLSRGLYEDSANVSGGRSSVYPMLRNRLFELWL
jgi:hypothetical protein